MEPSCCSRSCGSGRKPPAPHDQEQGSWARRGAVAKSSLTSMAEVETRHARLLVSRDAARPSALVDTRLGPRTTRHHSSSGGGRPGQEGAPWPAGGAVPLHRSAGAARPGRAAAMAREAPTCVHCGSSVRLREVAATVGREVLRHYRRGPRLAEPQGPDRHRLQRPRGVRRAPRAGHDVPEHLVSSGAPRRRDRLDLLRRTSLRLRGVQRRARAHPGPGRPSLRQSLRDPQPRWHARSQRADARRTHPRALPRAHRTSTPSRTRTVWVLVGTRLDGSAFTARDVVFHGGPGTTAEMRVHGRDDVRAHLHRAGFVDVVEHRDEDERAGSCTRAPPSSWTPRVAGSTACTPASGRRAAPDLQRAR